jgi:hypothetical protein
VLFLEMDIVLVTLILVYSALKGKREIR